ncbi:hypothetical protein COUCH_14370 [Couchioplanes caeruleus]|uniref:hypothetical protein n=1 Tax=Couchioplanes caeruleus TaxID=56438 RepID=UPI0020BFCEB8|nr:hypothetical protein [Couchioplanes caeruleus]UQU67374.1 hypothetical protein COUCH_14370 [Couchioplanes caeruleus]
MTDEPLREFDDGAAFWATRRGWPADLHDAFYRDRWAINDGTFTDEWWTATLPWLHRWKATRGATSAHLTHQFRRHRNELRDIWGTEVVPRLAEDITTVRWDDVKALPDMAARIKPTRNGSGVFPSKFAHFVSPRLFPVLDKTALPGRQHNYGSYFRLVQQTWADTSPQDQRRLRQRLAEIITATTGQEPFKRFPTVNKIVELRLIGRQHPTPL